MKKFGILLFVIFISTLCQLKSIEIVDSVKSKSENRLKFGLIGGFNQNSNESDFRQLPGVNYFAPKFNTADGTGYIFGILFESALLKKAGVSYILRLYYSNDKAVFTKNQITKEYIDNNEIDADVNYNINTTLEKLVYENLLSFRLINNLNLLAGFNFSLILGSNYDQKETLVKPEIGFFTNGLRTRHEQTGKIQNLSTLQSAVSVGINYDLKIGRKEEIIISPEISYSYSVTQITTVVDWKYHSFRINLALKYSPAPTDKIIEYHEETKYDTLKISADSVKITYLKAGYEVITKDSIILDNSSKYSTLRRRTDTLFIPELFEVPELQLTYEENNKPHELNYITLEEYLSSNQKPLLAYIFFDENSSMIPARYNTLNENQVRSFSYKNFNNKNCLETYLNILNIIGYRLNLYPEASITIIGCNSARGEERNNLNLSKERAEYVKEYLVKTWGIEQSRLSIQSRNLPAYPSSMNDSDGVVENRRVEIISDTPEIAKYLRSLDTIRKMQPEKISVKVLKMRNDSKCNIKLLTDKTEIIPYQSENPFVFNLNSPKLWNIDKISISSYGTIMGNIEYMTDVKTIPVKRSFKKVNSDNDNPFVEVYNLILFDFNSYKLGVEHIAILDEIRGKINKFKSVKIFGYSDRIGDESYNMNLSLKRAQEVAEYLNYKNTVVRGLGESQLLYDNTNPEGRFYSRTVIIELEK